MKHELTRSQVEQFHEEGFLIVRSAMPTEAMQPLINELEARVDDYANQAVAEGILVASKTFREAAFDERLALVCEACSEPNWIWRKIQHGKFKSEAVFKFRTALPLLDIVESLIGPEIYGHPQYALRAKMPGHVQTVVPWHQDLGYLNPETAGDTLFVNCWVPMVDAMSEDGCLQVIRGSHRAGYLPHERLLDVPDHTAVVGIPPDHLPEGEVVTCEVKKGDILLTMERVVHQSTPHSSARVRWSMDTRYSELGRPTGRTNVPGFVARSRNNPDSVAKSYEDWKAILESAGVALNR
jgi:phytanoyl-CoA hydroxylase